MKNALLSLSRYAELLKIIDAANEELLSLKNTLREEVVLSGSQISGYGYIAKMKPGRKSTDHKAAAIASEVNEDIIRKFTKTPAPKTSWAKVTKEAGISKDILAQYTTQGEASFVIELAT